MKIRVRRTGGVAGVLVSAEVDDAELPHDKAEQLRRLLDEADFFGLPTKTMARPLGPAVDVMEYFVEVSDGKRHRVLMGPDGTLPPGVGELAQFVLRNGRRPARGRR